MLRSFYDLARFYALCAHFHSAIAAARQLDTNGLQIGVKAASGLVISV
jgi:hypothetical protein